MNKGVVLIFERTGLIVEELKFIAPPIESSTITLILSHDGTAAIRCTRPVCKVEIPIKRSRATLDNTRWIIDLNCHAGP